MTMLFDTSSFISALRLFNRKERFFLVGWALGNRKFKLAQRFRRALGSLLHLDVPADSFGAMDYHLDWIYAAAELADTNLLGTIHSNKGGLMSGTQQDIDLVVAYEEGALSHLVMIEAKGVTHWTNRQLIAKAERLESIFGERADRYSNIRPHFLLVSPRESQRLNPTTWPDWMKRTDGRPYWLEMETPSALLRPTRCDYDGSPSEHGDFWTVLVDRGED